VTTDELDALRSRLDAFMGVAKSESDYESEHGNEYSDAVAYAILTTAEYMRETYVDPLLSDKADRDELINWLEQQVRSITLEMRSRRLRFGDLSPSEKYALDVANRAVETIKDPDTRHPLDP
jgi:hypothetical protein